MKKVSGRFAADAETERTITKGIDWNGVYRDRYSYARSTVYAEAMLAWRLNPLARTIVELYQTYTVDGIDFECEHEATNTFLRKFWEHDLNMIEEMLPEWSDEYVLTGNAFPILTTDRSGMSFVRIHPTDLMQEIRTSKNDVRQETSFLPSAIEGPDPTAYFNYYYKPNEKVVMLHSAVNRLAGMKWGEADLAPLLPWLARYASWLEDRVLLNHYRNLYLIDVTLTGKNPKEVAERRKEILLKDPQSGEINVHGEDEVWEMKSPQLNSGDADKDGLSLKKFIALGRGIPLHYLAEPESTTRTTADASGTPTFKRFERRQKFFLNRVKELLRVVVRRRYTIGGDSKIDPEAGITISAGDVSERDNAALSMAVSQIAVSMKPLVEAGYMTPEEYLRWIYRFGGEDPKKFIQQKEAPAVSAAPQPANPLEGEVDLDVETGAVTVKESKN